MAPPNFACRRVGAVVRAKAIAVTNKHDCQRRFGLHWKVATVTGTVTEVVTPPKGSRKQVSLVVDWTIGSEVKSKEVKVTNIRLASPEADLSVTPGQTEPADDHGITLVQDEVTASNNAESSLPPDEVEVHGVTWKEQPVTEPVNGYVTRRPWKVSHFTGQIIGENHGSNGKTPLDYFTWMFPMSHLGKIVTMTNLNLVKNGRPVTSTSEILRFFGVIVLMSRYEFGSRRDLWATSTGNKYIPAPNFGQIMPFHRFQMIRSQIRFSDNGNHEDDGEANRWGLVDDFVAAINEHREMYVTPSELICVDESMSRWYGLGGDWTDVGLPAYRAIDRKPENGCEIKNSACGRSGIMLRLKIVKSPTDDGESNNNEELSHGAAVTRRLVYPWSGTNRIVCGDSYFASVHTAQVLHKMGLRFIGVVKTANRRFPMKYLGALEVHGRGKWKSMIHRSESDGCDLAAVLWVDRDRRYFIASAGCTLPGTTIYRDRFRKVGNTSIRVVTETEIPQIAETYYEAASQIDRHNRCRQSDLNLEKKFQVKEWSTRVNTSLLAMCIVDSWLLYKSSRGEGSVMPPNKFYEKLAEQLIDNEYDTIITRSHVMDVPLTNITESGIGPHLTPTSRKRKLQDGTPSNCALQGRCKMCRNGTKSKYVCSACTSSNASDFWLCHSDTKRDCFIRHYNAAHTHD